MRWLRRRISRRRSKKVEKVAIWTPDKDLAQCVRGERVVQIDGRRKIIRDAAGIREKFGVDPLLIPDLLALVGDAADGYPGIPGHRGEDCGHAFESSWSDRGFPAERSRRTARAGAAFQEISRRCARMRRSSKGRRTLRWRGATPAFAAWAERMEAPRLLERCEAAAGR